MPNTLAMIFSDILQSGYRAWSPGQSIFFHKVKGKNLMPTFPEILQQIQTQWIDLLRVRAVFPTMGNDVIGAQQLPTAPYYRSKGYSAQISFVQPLTQESIKEVNEIGRWLNESYVIRLCAFLELHKIIPQAKQDRIDQNLEGHEEIDILRRVRNQLLHHSGRYNPDNSKNRKLYDRMVRHFSVEAENSTTATRYPIPIDTFLEPLTQACKRYVEGFFSHKG
jgi:hypothetical protein